MVPVLKRLGIDFYFGQLLQTKSASSCP